STADPATFARIVARFDALWDAHASRPLTAELVAAYQGRVRVPPAPEPAQKAPVPNPVQIDVLKLLAESRAEGARRGLVVMATGLGKTYLSAFDFARVGGERGERGKRLLFLAHREEILEQAEQSYARVFPDRSRGLLVGERRDVEADLLFASVQTVRHAEHLRAFDRDHFDYIVVDEFHHAAAPTYQAILAHFEPAFLLGLTATPDRMDGTSLLDACDGNLVARVGLVEGITRKLLVPFRYFGVKDTVDYQPIPWRSGRFDEEALTHAVATEARAAQALREYQKHAAPRGRRTLAFCVSRRHADFTAAYLRAEGLTAAAVHSGASSARVRRRSWTSARASSRCCAPSISSMKGSTSPT
ncbi:MAG: DEAD/DEAH box helicase family protein, partial [Myxococcales bacterium]|nr:DEAD/DEAH box helicase family protein [Myxococcales bacterium]